MAASKDRKAPRKGELRYENHGPVDAGKKIYQGTMVSHEANTGLMIPSTSTTASPAGCALEQADNTGLGDGATRCKYGEGVFGFINDATNPVTAAMVGNVCFVKDDQTVGATAVGNVIAGKVMEISDDDDLVYVLVGDAFVLNEAQT